MRFVAKCVLGSTVVLSATAMANAQTTGATGGATGGAGGISGGSIPGGSSSPETGFSAAPQLQLQAASSGAASGAAVNNSNPFASYYANPLFQGKAGVSGSENPGGFGTALYSSTGTGNVGTGGNNRAAGTAIGTNAQGRTGGGGGTTGRTGTTGGGGTGFGGGGGTGIGGGGTTGFGGAGTTGFGGTGRGGNTGFGGTTGRGRNTGAGGIGGMSGQSGGSEIIPLQRQISYTASVRIPTPVVTPTQMQTDLRGILDRSSMLSSPRNIQLLMQGDVIVLRGAVKDEEEARTAEGMIRLTPGVREVKNELTYATP